jgi:glycosyltransferase involved in cell wall biosynthesis/GR25 family glycosyltransferase involved in LPS biosynthesis
MKILFFASYPNIAIGYSRIANIITNYLAEKGNEIYYVGISNFDNQEKCDRYVHPNIKLIDAYKEEQKKNKTELYGVNIICDVIKQVQPDLVFLYNDIIVISRILNNFINLNINKTFKLYIYLDLVYKYEKINLINHVDKFADMIFVFSDYWKTNLIEMGINSDKIDIIYHGIDNAIFKPVDKKEAKKMFNFNDDDFVILNTNRNSYRKCIDKTIDSFIQFLKIKNMNKSIKLFLNMNLTDGILQQGYDIMNLIKVSCIKNKVDYKQVINNNIYKYSNKIMSDEKLNYLYNACDIGINTCVGEGFGLCNLEHGSIGRPQIISKVGGLQDIFSNEYATLIEPITEIYLTNTIDFHGGYLEICSTDDFTNALMKYYDSPSLIEQHSKLCRETLINKYNWDNILNNFYSTHINSLKKELYKDINTKINYIDHILWINLDRCTKRRNYMENLLELLDVPNHRISAIDGNDTSEYLVKLQELTPNLNKYEIATTLTHIKAINYCNKLKGNYFLIFEDDVSFDNLNYFTITLEDIIKNAPEFDMLRIHNITDHVLPNIYTNSKNEPYAMGASAYICSRKGIEKFIQISKYDDGKFQIYDKLRESDIFIYTHLNTFIYKYNFITTLNDDSEIHSDHLPYQRYCNYIALNDILKNKPIDKIK